MSPGGAAVEDLRVGGASVQDGPPAGGKGRLKQAQGEPQPGRHPLLSQPHLLSWLWLLPGHPHTALSELELSQPHKWLGVPRAANKGLLPTDANPFS